MTTHTCRHMHAHTHTPVPAQIKVKGRPKPDLRQDVFSYAGRQAKRKCVRLGLQMHMCLASWLD